MPSMGKLRLYDVCERLDGYINNDIAMKNVSDTLDARFDVTRIQVHELRPGMFTVDDWVFCRLKLKTLARVGDELSAIFGNAFVIVKEWDTPEAFMPASPLFGSYQQIARRLPNFVTFINQSKRWAEQVRSELKLPCTWTQTWVPPSTCADRPEPWDWRDRDVGFNGTVHTERKQFFDELRGLGVNVDIRPRVLGTAPEAYTQFIRRSKIIVRTERRNLQVTTGVEPFPCYLWQRDIEIASQGTFSLREEDRAYKEWGLDKVPSIVPFTDPQDAARKIEWLLSLSPKEAEQLLSEGIEAVRTAELPDLTPKHQHMAWTVEQFVDPTSFLNLYGHWEWE